MLISQTYLLLLLWSPLTHGAAGNPYYQTPIRSDLQMSIAKTEELFTAIEKKEPGNVLHMLDLGFDPNSTFFGQPAICAAARIGDLLMVKALIDHGANINTQDRSSGKTALSIAVACGKNKVVSYLLENAADPLKKDFDEQTALDIARKVKNKEGAQLLEQVISD